MSIPLIGSTINNKYKIRKLLGRGGQCQVYLAEDKDRGVEVVVKELTKNSSDISVQKQNINMFRKEFELLHRLSHKNLPEGYEYFEEKGKHFIVVEYIKGKNLKIVLENKPSPFKEEEVIDFGIQLSEVLVYLSNMKPPLVVRDIKPANIMLTTSGEVKLIDFTIAREISNPVEGDTVRIGSIGYAPPEQYKGKSDTKSDIYALGATLYELLTKHDPSTAPFQFEPVRHLDPGLSLQIEKILLKALELNPALRYEKAEDILHDLSLLKKEDKIFDCTDLINSCQDFIIPEINNKKKSWKFIIILTLLIIIGIIIILLVKKI